MVAVPSSQASSILATKASTDEWKADLRNLFVDAKESFHDVVWALGDDPDKVEKVWGHKAIILYARVPLSRQVRYFKFDPALSTVLNSDPLPLPNVQSACNISIPPDVLAPGASSPTPPTNGIQILRLSTNIAPNFFAKGLEYLYTGKRCNGVSKLLFDNFSDEEVDDEARVKKLRNDLVHM